MLEMCYILTEGDGISPVEKLVFVVPKERVTWEFIQEEFRKKYISEIFVEQKRKEFLELKQGNMTVA